MSSPVTSFLSGPAHLGSGDAVVLSVKVPLAFGSCHEEIELGLGLLLTFETLLEDSFTSIFCVSWTGPLQSSLLASRTWWDPDHIV